jgi:hypothetical protein
MYFFSADRNGGHRVPKRLYIYTVSYTEICARQAREVSENGIRWTNALSAGLESTGLTGLPGKRGNLWVAALAVGTGHRTDEAAFERVRGAWRPSPAVGASAA